MITRRTADALNAFFGKNFTSRDWGRVVESLKDYHHIANNVHGNITIKGEYQIGKEIIDSLGNLSNEKKLMRALVHRMIHG